MDAVVQEAFPEVQRKELFSLAVAVGADCLIYSLCGPEISPEGVCTILREIIAEIEGGS